MAPHAHCSVRRPNAAHKATSADERLTAVLITSRTHFESRVAALLLSRPQLQQVLPASGNRGLMELVAKLEQPLLDMLRRKGRPLMLNHVRVGGAAAPVRLLAVPVSGPVAHRGASVWGFDRGSLLRAFELMETYADRPMDLADASLIVATEELKTCKVSPSTTLTFRHTVYGVVTGTCRCRSSSNVLLRKYVPA